ncbi:MAG: hypothetical protein RL058_1208, partial [Actinomycetota bacterium]
MIVTIMIVPVMIVPVMIVIVVRVTQNEVSVHGPTFGIDHLHTVQEPVHRLGLTKFGTQIPEGIIALIGLEDLSRFLTDL